MNTEQIMSLSHAYVVAVERRDFALVESTKDALESAIEAMVQERDAKSEMLDEQVAFAIHIANQRDIYQREADRLASENKVLRDSLKPDMFWNHDDAERLYQGIGEFLNDEICNGSLEVGDIRTVQQAKQLPRITIQITSIDENESEAEWVTVLDTDTRSKS